MDRNEARLLLQAYRPGGQDANNPVFVEALRLVEQDPELRKWWAAQQAFDRKVSAKLKDIPLPSDLRASILAGHKLQKPAAKFSLPHWLAIAAAVAVLAFLTDPLWAPHKGMPTTLFTASVLPLLGHNNPHLGMESTDHERIKAWLKERNSPMGHMPPGLADQTHIGCQTYAVQGHTVTLVCFEMKDGKIAHLFVVDKGALADPPGTSPSYTQNGEWATASWSDDKHSYVLATTDTQESLRQLL